MPSRGNRVTEELVVLGILGPQRGEVRIALQGLGERGRTGAGGDLLGDLVHVAQRHVEHTPHVAHNGPRSHRPERHDLRHAVRAVALARVLNDTLATLLAEVDVDVGHRHAAGVQEALEQKVVLERVEARDVEQVRDDRAGRRTPTGPDRDAVVAGPLDQVPHDQKYETNPSSRMTFFSCSSRSRARWIQAESLEAPYSRWNASSSNESNSASGASPPSPTNSGTW